MTLIRFEKALDLHINSTHNIYVPIIFFVFIALGFKMKKIYMILLILAFFSQSFSPESGSTFLLCFSFLCLLS